jgi:hypothetical protein
VLADAGLHSCPSAITVGHVGLELLGQVPVMQGASGPHAWPGCAGVTAAHCAVVGEQARPGLHSMLEAQGAPAFAGAWHTAALEQISGGAHSWERAQAAPAVLSDAHFIETMSQVSPLLHCNSSRSHVVPASLMTMGWQVEGVESEQAEPAGHAPVRESLGLQDAPTARSGAQVPHGGGAAPASVEETHLPLSHCVLSWQPAPSGKLPLANMHAGVEVGASHWPGCVVAAAAQARSWLAVTPSPGSASRAVHVATNRSRSCATASGGSMEARQGARR